MYLQPNQPPSQAAVSLRGRRCFRKLQRSNGNQCTECRNHEQDDHEHYGYLSRPIEIESHQDRPEKAFELSDVGSMILHRRCVSGNYCPWSACRDGIVYRMLCSHRTSDSQSIACEITGRD